MASYCCSGGVKTLLAALKRSQQMFRHLSAFYCPGFLLLKGGGGRERGRKNGMDGGEKVLNIRRPTAGCFSLPECINLFGPLAAVPVQGASQHLGLKVGQKILLSLRWRDSKCWMEEVMPSQMSETDHVWCCLMPCKTTREAFGGKKGGKQLLK